MSRLWAVLRIAKRFLNSYAREDNITKNNISIYPELTIMYIFKSLFSFSNVSTFKRCKKVIYLFVLLSTVKFFARLFLHKLEQFEHVLHF